MKAFALSFFLSLMTYSWLQAQETAIIYIGDPMCSWCYGFAPEISKVKTHFDSVVFRLIVGGLRPGGTENMADLGEFLEHHWQEVSKRSGQPFNYGIIGDSSFILDTEPGCRAVVASRSLDPKGELEFFKAVQGAFFVGNKDMRAPETFADIAEDIGLDRQKFLDIYQSEECRYDTRADFQLAAEMGIRGFPSVVVQHNGQFFLVANGYLEAEKLIKTIERVLENKS